MRAQSRSSSHHRRRLRPLAGIVILVIAAGPSLEALPAHQAPGDDSSAELLRSYETSPADAMARVTSQRMNLEALASDIKKNDAFPLRLRAALTLELAFVSMHDYMTPRPPRNILTENLSPAAPRVGPKPRDFVEIFNVAYGLAESVTGDDGFGKTWRDTALSILEAGAEVPPQNSWPISSGELLLSFLSRSASDFAPGRVHLARASAYERAIFGILSYSLPTYRGFHPPQGSFTGAGLYGNLERARSAALDELAKARADRAFRPLADVHVAQILLDRAQKDDLDEALRYLKESLDASPDRSTQYLAYLVRGQVYAATGNGSDATRAFRAAVTLIPNADSAALSLAGRLFFEGDRPGADALVRRVLGAPPTDVDPWAFFLMPEYARFDSRLTTLRDLRR